MKTISASTFLARRAMTRAALWVALALVACSAWAQSQPNDLSLTMTDAVNLALKQNPDVQIANLTLAAKQQERAIARSELLPHAGIASSESITRHNLKALVGFQLPGAPHNIGPYQAIHAGLTFSTPIFRIDVSRADVRLSEEKQRLIDAQAEQQTTLFALTRILNVPDSTRLRFTDEDSFFSTPALDISEPVQTALRDRPELLSLAATLRADEDDRRAAAAASLPKLSLTGRWDQEGGTLTTLAPGYEYSVNFRLPLFTGGRLKAEREAARIALQETQVGLTDTRNRVIEQTRRGQVELRAALDQTEVAKRQVSLANEELALAQDRFRTGITDNIEVVTAQDSLARANDSQIAALFRYSIARAELARAVGAVERTYNHP